MEFEAKRTHEEKPASHVSASTRPSDRLHPVTAAGNMAMQALLRGGIVRAKLAVGGLDDPEEREADATADRVMRSADASCCSSCGNGGRCEDETARRKPDGAGASTLSRGAEAHVRSLTGRGENLSPHLRAFFEPRLGRDLSQVRVHHDAAAADSARGIGARAYTLGSDIAFASGHWQPDTDSGRHLIAHELAHVSQNGAAVRRQPAADTTQAAAPAAPAQSPVYWGWDVSVAAQRVYYVSVPPPGHAFSDVANFLYGSGDAVARLHASNPGLGDFLQPGAVVHLTGDALSAAAQQSLSQALKTGLIMRTTGVPESRAISPDVPMHHLVIGQQTYDLLDDQYQALLRGLAWHIRLRADYVKDMCEVYRDTRKDHLENTNSWVRGISDWRGDVEVPDESVYTGPRSRAIAIIADIDSNEPTEQRVLEFTRRLSQANEDLIAGEHAWHVYIEGTIAGASKTASNLEVVRNTCFAIEAGLAGAVVAPVAFAAAGGGLLGAGAAVGAGAAAGGALRGSLEVALPGMQADKSVSERFWSGAKTGAVQGAIGAAGALAAPGVAASIAPRLGIVEGVAPTAFQRLALGVSTGTVIGAPSGAVGTAITNLGSLVQGEMSGTEYLENIGWGTVGGAAGGAVFGALPIKGVVPGETSTGGGGGSRGGGAGGGGSGGGGGGSRISAFFETLLQPQFVTPEGVSFRGPVVEPAPSTIRPGIPVRAVSPPAPAPAPATTPATTPVAAPEPTFAHVAAAGGAVGTQVGSESSPQKRPCVTGRYGSLTCPSGEQGHHIVADYTLRYGTRAEGIARQKRIPGLPLFYDGPAICLKGYAKVAGDEHSIAHQADAIIAGLGATNQPQGAAPISAITAASVASAIQARPDCAKEILAAVAVQPSLFGNTLGRTTLMPPGKWPP